VIAVHSICDGPARGWLHTHGLAEHGKPELEIRSVPMFLSSAACSILNDVADYLLNDATRPLLAGETMVLGKSVVLAVASGPDEAAGYDPLHYEGQVRLRLVDPPAGPCEREECAKERARRCPMPS
jgi:hypothetical protein